MANITIPNALWFRMADVIHDMGNHHPNFKDTPVGKDIAALGDAIKYGVSPYEGAPVSTMQQRHLDEAQTIIAKHGGGDPRRSIIEQAIDTAEKLIGIWDGA